MDIVEPTKKKEFESILPLVNIVFLLLIFFMLAGAFTKPDIFQVEVPEAQVEDIADRDELVIIMNADKEYAIDKTIYSEIDLADFLEQKVNENQDIIVQLKADQRVKSKDLITTMEMLGGTGLTSIRLLTLVEESN